jgi:polyisoprenoid-binding protein YceI
MRKLLLAVPAGAAGLLASAMPAFAVDPTVSDVTTSVQTQISSVGYAMVTIVLGLLAIVALVALAKRAPKAIRWGIGKVFG